MIQNLKFDESNKFRYNKIKYKIIRKNCCEESQSIANEIDTNWEELG